MPNPRALVFGLAFVVLTISGRAAQAQTPTPVTTCGSVVDNGYLTGDLDCTGIEAPLFIRHHGSLDLGGFTLYAGKGGVWCGNFVPMPSGGFEGNFGKCTISNGVIRDSTFSAINGKKVIVKNVSILDSGDYGIQGFGGVPHSDRVEVIDSTIAGSATAGVIATGVVLKNSTVTGNAIGIVARNAKLRDSSVAENGTNPACTTDCVDLRTTRRPRLKDSTCNRSQVVGGGGDWAVCTYDE
jgi:hypothetical protein